MYLSPISSRGFLLALLASCADASLVATETVETDELGVQAEISRSGSRLKAQYFRHTGFKKFSHFRDTARNLDCKWWPDENEQHRCLPGDAIADYYLDEACTQRAFWTPDAAEAANPPQYFQTVLDSGQGVTVYRVGAQVETNLVYFGGGGCDAVDVEAYGLPAPFHATRVAPNGFARGTMRNISAGGWRMRAKVIDGTDGSRAQYPIATLRYYDNVFHTDTTARPQRQSWSGANNRSVWMPAAGGWELTGMINETFSDASCTTSTATVLAPADPRSLAETNWQVTPSCEYDRDFLELEATAELSTVYVDLDGTCTEDPDAMYGHTYAVAGPANLAPYARSKTVRVGDGRLQAAQEWISDGSKADLDDLGTAYDTLLQNTCTIERRNNTWVCVPSSTLQIAYRDATCTQQGIMAYEGLPLEACFTQSVSAFDVSDAQLDVTKYTSGANLGTQMNYYRDEEGGCWELGEFATFAIASTTTRPLARLTLGQ